jgi:hypothetical protein
MRRPHVSKTRVVAILLTGMLVLVVLTVGLSSRGGRNSAGSKPSTTTLVLDPAFAKSVGFPKTYVSARKSTITGQKGCPGSVESVYENLMSKTALISEVVKCKSPTYAAESLTSGRNEVKVDSSIPIPKELGPSAFATDSEKSEYLVVWTVGSNVSIVGIDINIAGSSGTSPAASSTSITEAQQKTLVNAALKQNSLFN